MILPFNLRQQVLDAVQIPARSQSHSMGLGMVGAAPCRLFHGLQAGSKRLVDHASEWLVQPHRDGSRSVQNVVINNQCRSHTDIIASSNMMSRHHRVS